MRRTDKRTVVVGTRGSRLARAQAEGALEVLRATCDGAAFRLEIVETPGDRDLSTPIEKSAPDFFTRDLDAAVRSGRIDLAIHSAKDLPDPMPEGIDWFWLPGGEDARDCWVFRAGDGDWRRGGAGKKIGVSSARREAYARKVYPKARTLPIRGAIDARIAQLLAGDFDAVLMAVAGLRRLYGERVPGVELRAIALDELTPPEAQGRLAVTFRAGDARGQALRAKFVKAVRFVSAGVGDAGLCTCAGARDIALADVVLHDDLLGHALVKGAARAVNVGKRCGAHTLRQPEITRLICDEARKGRRVARLKGGDAGVFGRLAEETDALAALGIPFVVRPGVSALTAATTGTGLLLTRRGEACGFSVHTPRSSGTETTRVAFMAARVAAGEARALLADGRPEGTPCAMVYDAAGPRERIVTATLAEAARGALNVTGAADLPGLFIAGPAAARAWPKLGELGGRRVLVTCSEALQEKACAAVEDRGGRPVPLPLIELRAARTFGDEVADYDAVVLTSPSAVRIFFVNCACDRRRLPAFYTCGAGTDAELRRFGVSSDVCPAADFSAAGLIAEIRKLDLTGTRVLRLRSAKAGRAVAAALRRAGARVDDVVLYENRETEPSVLRPADWDAVFFASASAVEVYLRRYGERGLRGKDVFVMGDPTRAALPERFRGKARVFDAALGGASPSRARCRGSRWRRTPN